jgi:tetratricopeptide (TPR) repeat protein
MNIQRGNKNEIQAIKTARRLHKIGYNFSYDTLFRYANTAHDNKEHELALYFSKVCNVLRPNSANILNLVGVSYFYLKKYRISLVAFKAAVYYNSEDSIYWANLARSYENLEEYEKALTYYQLSLKKEPGFRRSLLSVDRVKGLLQNQRQN